MAIAALVTIYLYVCFPHLLLGPDPLEPLQFYAYNEDVDEHSLTVEIFDSSNRSIFKEIYELNPKERIKSPEITKRRGEYVIKVTLDDEITRTYKAKVDYWRFHVRIAIYAKDPTSGELDIQICQAVT